MKEYKAGEKFNQKQKRTGHGRVEKGGGVEYTATYKVNRSDELLEFLLKKCNTSRNNVKSLLTRRQVLVNGSVVTQYNFALAKDDEVKLARRSVKEGVAPTAKNTPTKRPVKRLDWKIIYEDEEFIAIDKPVGLLSVESDKERECAFSYVLDYLQKTDKTARPYVLHRIDKETSGVLVFAKDIKIHSKLKMRWNELVTKREYYAVVEGVPESKENTIISYLKENENHIVYSTQDKSGQKAITHYTVEKQNGTYALLRVRIDTGRKNQIRVHLHGLGHPIVGDEKYGFEKNPLGRLGLHASALEFTHPSDGRTITITAPIPLAFKSIF